MTALPQPIQQSQAELRRYAGPLSSFLENAGLPLVVTDPRLPDNPVVFANHAFEQLTGYTSDDVIGSNCRFLQSEATDRGVIQKIHLALEAGFGVDAVLLNARKNGTVFWNKLTITPIHTPTGEVAFFVGTQADVTASHEADAVNYRVGQGIDDESAGPMVSHTGIGGAWYWEIDTGIIKADAYFAALHGLDPVVFAQGAPNTLFFAAIHPEDRMRIRMAVTGMLNGATVFSKDFRLVSSDGTIRWVHAEGRTHLDEEDRPVTFAGRLIDITDQKRIEERLRIAQTAGRIGAFEHTEGFGTVTVSAQFCDLIGVHHTDILPISTINAIVEAGSGSLIDTKADMPTRGISEAEFQIKRADTSALRWIARRSELVRDLDTAHVRHVGVIYDITIAKEREHQLRDLNEQLEMRVEARTRDRDRFWKNSRDLLVTMDAGGVIREINPAWMNVLGYRPQEVVGRNFFDFAAEEPSSPFRRPVDTISIAMTNFESCFAHKNGTLRWISWLTSQEGDLTYAYGRHITNEKAKEEALHLERARLRAIFDTTSQLIGFAEPDGSVIVLNRASLETMDAHMSEVAGRKFWELPLFADTPGMPERIKSGIEMAMQGEIFVSEITVKLPHGGDHTYELALRPVRDHSGQIVQIVPEAFDTTVLRRTEEQLRQSQKMEAIGQLTGGIAHDFNNLLTGIIGSLDLIGRRMEAGRTEDLTRFMNAATAAAQRAAALTHRLLAFARRQSLDVKPSDVNALIASMEDLLRRALGEQVQVHTALNVDGWLAMTDKNQLENAILNLAINARDAMPTGGKLTIGTANQRLDASDPLVREALNPGDYVVISVSDTGTGMPPDVLAKVFDPFFTTKPMGQGTGLGLSMVYGFLKQSNGHIDIDSDVGQGTRIRLLLPRALAEDRHSGEPGAHPVPPGRGETVLVVEDDPTVRLLISEVLIELGYHFFEATDSSQAIPLLQSEARIDLIISDVGLPGMSGRQLADLARSLRPDLKILFATGYDENVTVRGGLLKAGMDMITKPFSLNALAAKIRQILEE